MNVIVGLVVILTVIGDEVISGNDINECPNVKNDLRSIRKRRHLTFPEGTMVVLTMSLVKAYMTHAPAGWNLALELDVLHPLPDSKFTNELFRRKLHHRQKREFWESVKSALNIHNLNGHSCILRSICDAKIHLAPRGKSLVHDMLRAIFSAPQNEMDFNEEVGETYKELTDPQFCEKTYDCPFPLIGFVLNLNKK